MNGVGGLTLTGKLLVTKMRLFSLLSYTDSINETVLKSLDLKVCSR